MVSRSRFNSVEFRTASQSKSGRSASRAQAAKPLGPSRLRKACDSCSIRKSVLKSLVSKCDESGPPCKACFDLDIPCTSQRPTKRRGPPNRHAEAVRRSNVRPAPPNGSVLVDSSASPPPSSAVEADWIPALKSDLSAECICPLPVLDRLIDDFFFYIHPLIPVPHEPTFRAALEDREDRTNKSFLALLASMVATLVVSFPRKPIQHLREGKVDHLYPNSMSLIEQCRRIAAQCRGPGFLDKEPDIYSTATSYFLGLTAAYTFDLRRCRLYLSECLALIRLDGIERAPSNYNEAESPASPSSPTEPSPNHIERQTSIRLFWLMLAAARTLQQLGAPLAELIIPPAGPKYQYPSLPAEVDDEYITATQLGPQPASKLSKLAGFNINVRIYTAYDPLIAMEMGYGIDPCKDWARQRRILMQCLNNVKSIAAEIPTPLALGDCRTTGHDHTSEAPDRAIPFEIEKANICASQLGTRSYIVEKYWHLFDAQGRRRTCFAQHFPSPSSECTNTRDQDEIEVTMWQEREQVIHELSRAIESSCLEHIEPLWQSFINKVRLIASTLIGSHPGPDLPIAAGRIGADGSAGPISPSHSLGARSDDSETLQSHSPVGPSPIPTETGTASSPSTSSPQTVTTHSPSDAAQNQNQQTNEPTREDYLCQFLKTLDRLERNRTSGSDDDEKVKQTNLWADFGALQEKFSEGGGVLTYL
ncbi:MAG: hypothetical protein M1814_003981 [Vezdaea aestivalis]|nr:MAG: hypothetical protein M1814_003981 [Vezdaea aestivalis]